MCLTYRSLSKKVPSLHNLTDVSVFHPYEYMSDFETFKKELLSKEEFYSLLTGKKVCDK